MRIIFSRKGFDHGSGGTFSPIIEGRPVSLPIPTKRRSPTSYNDLGLGEIVEKATGGKIARHHLCHEDPMFAGGRCAFGQTGAAQSHLANQGVGVGDVFLFFGLFSDGSKGGKHHRIFGYLKVSEVIKLGSAPTLGTIPGFKRPHPHGTGEWNPNNTLYVGTGSVARRASDKLRLTVEGEPLCTWRVPRWLRDAGLTYHSREDRWFNGDRLNVVARGQEFVTNVEERPAAHHWLEEVIQEINK